LGQKKEKPSLVASPNPSGPSPRKVLVADDSALVRDIVAKRAATLGFVTLACDSVAATRAVDPNELVCALLDLDLGDGKGTDVAAALRASRPELPIAFFSSNAPGTATTAVTFGRVFAKPDELDQAIAWIATHARP
jgi:CheY-like chemotaxis protein